MLSQFAEYKKQLKKCSLTWEMANDFDYILNNAWCTYSFSKARKKFNEIRKDIPEPYHFKISIEMDHVELGHRINQARLALKDEMSKYIDYLLNEL